MKNTKKAFTLVELIVVITILAVLATVAFISLTGYSQEAKNSKVTADLRTMVSAVEAKMTKESILPKSLVLSGTDFVNNTMIDGTNNNYKSGAVLDATVYAVGSTDFQALGQNGDDFNSDGKKYAIAAVASSYQFAGEITEDGVKEIVLKGNYVQGTWANVVPSLISTNATGTPVPLTNGTGSAAGSLLY